VPTQAGTSVKIKVTFLTSQGRLMTNAYIDVVQYGVDNHNNFYMMFEDNVTITFNANLWRTYRKDET
jgi:hypothetical protein